MRNHLAATLIRGQPVEPIFLAIQHADARGAVDLMPAEHEEVAIKLLHVDLEMGCTLGPIYDDRNVMFMCNTNDFRYRIDGSQDVADMRDAHNLGLFAKHTLEGFEVENAVIVYRNDLQNNAFSGLLKLPRNNIRMVFDGGNDDFVAFLHESFTETRRDEIESFGGSAGENNLICGSCMNEPAHRFACSLMQFCSLLAEPMHSAMHVGIDIHVFFAHRIQHTERLLRGGRVVEIDKWAVINGARENGEILSYPV